MKILLINPPLRRMTGIANFYFPMGLAYLAAVLEKEGHEVKIYDVDMGGKLGKSIAYITEYQEMQNYIDVVNNEKHPIWQEVTGIIERFEPDIVGIRVQTITYASAMKIAELVKKYDEECDVVMGGPHSSIKYEQVLADENVDFVVREEGEVTFSELIKKLEEDNASFGSVKGICYKTNGAIVVNPVRDSINNLDLIPHPARKSLMYSHNYSPEDMGVLMASRGCPFSCTYCFNMWGRKVRYRSVENVIEEIISTKKDYGTYQFSFKDDTFTLKRQWVEDICNRLIEERIGINWECTTRADFLDDDLIKLMKNAGCNTIKIGVESGSETILKEIKKGVTLEQIREAAGLLNKNTLFWCAYFMMGLPQETKEDMEKTYKFMKELNPHYASIGIYKPVPNTELFNLGVKLGILKPEMTREEYMRTNPIDYYYIDPNRRTVNLNEDDLSTITKKMLTAFDAHNKKFTNLLRRGLSRKKTYLINPRILVGDLSKMAGWIGCKK